MNISDKRILDILGRYRSGAFAVTIAFEAKISRREMAKLLSRLHRTGKVTREYNTKLKSFEYRTNQQNRSE